MLWTWVADTALRLGPWGWPDTDVTWDLGAAELVYSLHSSEQPGPRMLQGPGALEAGQCSGELKFLVHTSWLDTLGLAQSL